MSVLHTTDKVFALKCPEDVLKKLCWEISELKLSLAKYHHSPFVPAYNAFNSTVTAWQLTDWVWKTTPPDQRNNVLEQFGGTSVPCDSKKEKIEQKAQFHEILRCQCRALHLCQQFATGSKHMIITGHPDRDVEACASWDDEEPARAGVMRAGDPLVKYRCQLTVKDKHDTRPAPDVFIDAYKYWKDFLPKWRACLT
jgi:hypothetical protein